jgi:Spy/CpxP family protein refolding chaperone
MNSKRTLSLLLGLAVLPGMALAQDSSHRHGEHAADQQAPAHRPMPGMVLMHAHEIGLTPQQRERIESLQENTRLLMHPLIQQMRALQHESSPAVGSDQLDEQKMRSIARRSGEIHEGMLLSQLRAQRGVGRVLNSEQLGTLELLHQEHHGSGRGEMGMGMMMECPMMSGSAGHGNHSGDPDRAGGTSTPHSH